MKKRALISGITGQDGSYLAEFLLEKNHEVHGIVRRVAVEDTAWRYSRIHHVLSKIIIHPASLESYTSLCKVFETVRPDVCYHLAAQSNVAVSFDDEFSTWNVNVNGTHYMLAALKRYSPNCRFYFAASSEMFGNTSPPLNEDSAFSPRSIYGITKLIGFHLTKYYRERHFLFACSGICFNHESPRRGTEFVTRKITDGVARIEHGLSDRLVLGNLKAIRDWGYAKDYVRAMYLMAENESPRDYVIATGISHSVEDFVRQAFECVGKDWKKYVEVNPVFCRPQEVDFLQGDSSRIRMELDWKPTISFDTLVQEMVEHDLNKYGGQ